MAAWRAHAKLFPSCGFIHRYEFGVFSSSNSQQRYWTQESVCAPERAFDFRKSEIGPAFYFPPRERNSRQVPRAERLSHPCLGEVHSQSSGWEKSGGKKKRKRKKQQKWVTSTAPSPWVWSNSSYSPGSFDYWLLEANAYKAMLLLMLLIILE